MPTPILRTPTADLGLAYSIDAFGTRFVDLPLTASNDLKLVTGMDRLLQDLSKGILVAKGQDALNPDYGFALWADVGQPFHLDPHSYVDEVVAFGDEFIAYQADAISQGFLATDEQLDHFEDVVVLPDTTTFTLVINLLVASRAGAIIPHAVTLA